jgi:hypothetical protein
MIASSTCSGSRPDRLKTSWATVVPRSTAGTSLSVPLKVPMAVLKGVEITISVPLLPLPKFMILLFYFRYHLRGILCGMFYHLPAQYPNLTLTNTAIGCLRSVYVLTPNVLFL